MKSQTPRKLQRRSREASVAGVGALHTASGAGGWGLLAAGRVPLAIFFKIIYKTSPRR